MTVDDLRALQTAEGQAALASATAGLAAGQEPLAVVEQLRRQHPAPLARAALEQAELRRRAAGKFPQAEQLYFTRAGLEMATAAPVAAHTAARFAGLGRVLDLCCGIGGDTAALARVAGSVTAVERDPLTAEIARLNLAALGLGERVRVVEGDCQALADGPLPPLPKGEGGGEGLLPRLPTFDGIFTDPSRRESRAAARRPESYSPPLSWCLGLAAVTPRLGIKVSPALDYEQAAAGLEVEVEVISLDGEAKEAVLWLGGFRTCKRRATVLPGEHTLTDEGAASSRVRPVGAWLYEPDPAVIRAHLVQRLAAELGLWLIEPTIAYLSGDEQVETPFARSHRVRHVVPWGLKRLNALLAAEGIGRVTIKKRGFPLTPEQLRPQLKLAGSRHATLICTRLPAGPVVLVAD